MRLKQLSLGMAAAFALSFVVPLTAIAAENVVVTPGNLQGWEVIAQSTAEGSFTTLDDSPLGSGSFRMSTGPGNQTGVANSGTAGGKLYFFNKSTYGTKLTDLTNLTYSSFIEERANNTLVAPSVNINVNTTGDPESAIGWTTLVYEPVYNSTNNVPTDTWDTWNTLTGIWWSTRDLRDSNGTLVACNPNGENANTPECSGKLFVPLTTLTGAFPGSVITGSISETGTPVGGVQLVAGQKSFGAPWNDFVGHVDNVTINNTTYDLEPEIKPANRDECKNDNWKRFNSPPFKNQGDCVSSVSGNKSGSSVAERVRKALSSLF